MEIPLKTWKKALNILLFLIFLYLIYNDIFINTREKAQEIAINYSNSLSFNGVVVKKLA